MLLSDIILLSVIFCLTVAFAFYRYSCRVKRNRLLNRIKKTDLKYLEMLEEKGYHLYKYDLAQHFIAEVEDKIYSHYFRIPMAVKGGNKKRYLVYIKKGKDSFRLSTKKIREQMLLLCLVFNVQGILILDTESGKIKSVIFKGEKPNVYVRYWMILFLILAAIIAVRILFLKK